MLISFSLTRIISHQDHRTFTSSRSFVRLADYGFESGGFFSFKINGANLSGVSIRLQISSTFTLDPTTAQSFEQICTHPANSSLAHPLHGGRMVEWQGNV
jgi:hypothetical protein